MDIGIIVFAYNRSQHLSEVLAGLKKNHGIDKLYIFQDGLKCEEHRLEWEKTKTLIEAVDWCVTDYRLSPHNKGLASSLVDGINAVFEENDAVIVLEDDCVPAPGFISFMTQCFVKYQDQKQVYSVSGYNWPFDMKKGLNDIYGCGRFSSWGWGTWKDRWSIYHKDYELLRKAKQDKELSRRLALWGSDVERILVSNIQGNANSWAVFWILEIIFYDGICINPYKSLIRNIGMDGTGIHCGVTDKFDVVLDESTEMFKLPDHINILKEAEMAIADICGSYTAASEFDDRKENILVYGVGNFFKKNEKQINQDYNILKFVDKYKSGYFAGKEIIKPDEINQCDYDKIIIMIQDAELCIEIARKMMEYQIEYTKIILGILLY